MLDFGKREVNAMAEHLEGDFRDVEEAAHGVLTKAVELLSARVKYVVVGQVVATKERGPIAPSDPEAVKICVGMFSTEGKARSAAESLWTSTQSGDTLRTWVLPVFHGTPAQWHGTQREKYQEQEDRLEAAHRERLRKQIEKRTAEAAGAAHAAA